MTFGTRLQALRRHRGLTQQQLADILQVTKRSIGLWENDIHRPRSSMLHELAAYFGISNPESLSYEPLRHLALPVRLLRGAQTPFILQAEGEGMKAAGISSGDLLVFDRSRVARSGDIAAVNVQGELLCRRIFFEADGCRLHREDGSTPDLLLHQASIRGVLIGRISESDAAYGLEMM